MKSIQLHIPKPCSENWNAMTEAGNDQRHCASCDRVLTDFTSMSDDELVSFFRHRQGRLCGRFSKAQLDRTLTLLPEEKRTQHWWKAAALVPLALFAGKANAQVNTPLSKTPRTALFEKGDKNNTPPQTQTVSSDTTSYCITGVVLEEASKEPMFGVTVRLYADTGKASIINSSTDMEGRFSITVPENRRQLPLHLRCTSLGFQTFEIYFPAGLSTATTPVQANMKQVETMLLGDIIVMDEPAGANIRKPFWSKIRGVFAIK